MSHNHTNWYDLDPHTGEWYDGTQRGTEDVEQIRRLIGTRRNLRVLEPFCGTGRILIPLAEDGHELVGLDQAGSLLDRASTKIATLPEQVRNRITLTQADVTEGNWPKGFDVVLLAGNCFYELATPEEQEGCVVSAAASLNPGGYLYYDSDHMEGELAEAWRKPGRQRGMLSGWASPDGTYLEWSSETIWFDGPRRLWRARRWLTVTAPDGSITEHESIQQKHPVSAYEVRDWLVKHGFQIEQHYGNNADAPYDDSLNRTTFWARKCVSAGADT